MEGLLGLRRLMSRRTQPADWTELACKSHNMLGTSQYIPAHTNIYWHIQACQCTCAYWYVPIYIQSKNISPRFERLLNVGRTWRQGMDTRDLSHLENYDFGQSEQHVLWNTGFEARLEVQHRLGRDRWAPSAGPDSVEVYMPWHESIGCTWRHLCCLTNWPQTWCSQYGHAVKANHH